MEKNRKNKKDVNSEDELNLGGAKYGGKIEEDKKKNLTSKNSEQSRGMDMGSEKFGNKSKRSGNDV